MPRSGHSRSRSRIGIIANSNRRVAGWAERADALDPGNGKMKLPQAGGCLCGKIRYEITEAPRLVYTCHCTDCQHLTSSAFSIALAVAGFRLMGGEPRPLEAIADSGRVKIRGSARNVVAGSLAPANPVMGCSECGSALWTIPRGRPTKHFWVRSKQPWITLPERDQVFETQPA